MKNYLFFIGLSLKTFVLIIASIVSFFTVIIIDLPRVSVITDIISKTSSIQKEIDDKSKQLVDLNDLNRIDFNDRIQVLEDNLPLEFEITHIISSLKQLANITQVELREASAVSTRSEYQTDSQLKEQQINVTIFGQTENLLSFVDQITKINPIITILNLDHSNLGTETNMATVKLSIQSYYYPNSTPRPISTENTKIHQISAQDEQLYESLQNRHKYEYLPYGDTSSPTRDNPFVNQNN